MVNISDVVKDRIEELKANGHKVTKTDIAKAAGVSTSYITDLINSKNDKRWNEELLNNVLNYLCIEVKFVKKRYRKVG